MEEWTTNSMEEWTTNGMEEWEKERTTIGLLMDY